MNWNAAGKEWISNWRARLSGARFVVLNGAVARIHRALGQFMLDRQTTRNGYTETNPPVLVLEDTMIGTGQLPKFADDKLPDE